MDTARLGETTKTINHIPAASRTVGATNGTGIDTLGFTHALVTLVGGDIGASTTCDLKIQEDDAVGGSYSDISGAAIVQLGASDDNKSPTIDVRLGARNSRKRFIRAVLTVGGSNAVVAGVDVKLYGAQGQPVTNSPATVFA